MTSGTRGPGRPPDPEREAAILDAALEVLAEVGYDRLTVSAVHKRAHASAKTVYRRWSGKEELMTAALQHAVTRAGHESAELPDTGTLRGDLVANLHRPSAAPTRNLTHGLLAVAASSGELGALALELLRSQEARLMKVILARARERGEVGDGVDAMLVADVTRGMTLQHLLLTDEPADAEFVETLVDRVLLPVINAGRSGV
ncbi:TetR/AcrR family transcriptional regulator [Pseudonocardia sp. KRD-184]|uniref:TetR/AcrR family transcriptional regulator n=1 Tax=Pseudonocardia oceani TaxID=2792013 RepID=A0ABS6UCT8_9PSEU|nr:TetR/AcrR family transcriptional regulator [Pseudonocardia oceani]MBW0091742.1 TetR/AcrR family transcriptional regulator [Pseudonocardia oceani]MBW0094418.1 TetR/AcrR family transcriptional regulator [Pseudonocardia oceani]MBW0107931.1 TetR/AcrR family transcriptional regulator [Pseudonocardia oceani]MBW0119975.1 TetR/AcrR family transcriptional regulator [Pseudonocardia oceani]MBW0130055.1 TetR/AcrR family transcriptional regulator [Pseudonocardia oceani]